MGFGVHLVLGEDGRVAGVVVLLEVDVLVVELPIGGQRGDHALVDTGSEDGFDGVVESLIGHGLRGGDKGAVEDKASWRDRRRWRWRDRR